MELRSGFILLLLSVAVFGFSVLVSGKECTNIPTQLSSHTLRYDLLSSSNASWREEMFSYYHLIPTDDSAWSTLRPRRIMRENDEEFSWATLYRNMKYSGRPGTAGETGFLKEVSLHKVRLDPETLHWRAQQTNLEYLLMLDVDSLVWSFRKTAGLPTPGSPYAGWEAPNCELRGHFVGHYMSASAHMWAATQNDALHAKMSAVVSTLSECQKAIGTGYLSAFSSEQFDRFEAIKPVWAPYYTIHKILAGLLDQYTLAGNDKAYQMAIWMVDYFSNRVQNVIRTYTIERHWLSLNEETGGMNDVLYRLYTLTGNKKHLVLAHLFDKPCFLGLLAVQADSLSGFHANTHIPVVIGSQMRYEVTGDPLYKHIATFFMDAVNSSHTYATGGTSVSEFWSDPKRLASTLQTENEESCTTYNMLKVSRHLFRWTKEISYADHYERALTNGVLSIQRGTEPGVMIYMLPLGSGVSKAHSYHGWGTPFNVFWCCYGTGIESFSKLGDSIYFLEEGDAPGLYIIQFISSSLSWDAANLMLSQKVEPVVSWDPFMRVSLDFSQKGGDIKPSKLNVRIPSWTDENGLKAKLNGRDLPVPSAGSFLSLTRKWVSADKLYLQFPIGLRTEAIKDDRPQYASLQALLFGPYLLAGLTDGEYNLYAGASQSLDEWITAVPPTYNSQLVSLTQDSDSGIHVFTHKLGSITMEKLPASGTDSAVYGTFRLVMANDIAVGMLPYSDIIGKSVMLEPFSMPKMVVVHEGLNSSLGVMAAESVPESGTTGSTFQVVQGLDGRNDSVSLESASEQGCFIYTGPNLSAGQLVQLGCPGQADAEFKRAASFGVVDGISKYHSMSFMAKGSKRNFLLAPLFSLRDESYTVYFNITT
ncbi:uncharacterized protein LOC116256061 isoform X1 [Nymphaea colorata]|nr:uncharacterized protein LOC116256061 isoform X1 [Nymphaea colorata]